MDTPDPHRQALEDLWRNRLQDAQSRLDFARTYVKEVQRDFPIDGRSADGHYAHQHALRAENAALLEYRRVLEIFSDLVVYGKIPNEGSEGAGEE